MESDSDFEREEEREERENEEQWSYLDETIDPPKKKTILSFMKYIHIGEKKPYIRLNLIAGWLCFVFIIQKNKITLYWYNPAIDFCFKLYQNTFNPQMEKKQFTNLDDFYRYFHSNFSSFFEFFTPRFYKDFTPSFSGGKEKVWMKILHYDSFEKEEMARKLEDNGNCTCLWCKNFRDYRYSYPFYEENLEYDMIPTDVVFFLANLQKREEIMKKKLIVLAGWKKNKTSPFSQLPIEIIIKEIFSYLYPFLFSKDFYKLVQTPTEGISHQP